jgi:membrane-bound lytic murein transglycosylase D
MTGLILLSCAQNSTLPLALVPSEIKAKESPAQPAISTNLSIKDLNIKAPELTVAGLVFESAPVAEPTSDQLQQIFAEFDVPMADTPRVQYYLNYFTGNGRATMQAWLDRSNKYMYMVRDIFKSEGIPLDLAVLAFTESGYNPRAYSHAGASGMWQFMKATGKMYGLNDNDWVDERRDFEKATLAAARHLKDLYEVFDDWYLALAAYNAGSGRISRAAKNVGSKDFFTIATGRTLKLETRDYVPKYLAQLLIYKNMEAYGFTTPAGLPLLYDKIDVPSQTNIYVIASVVGCEPDLMKELNPELKTPMTPPGKAYSIRVPLGAQESVLAYVNNPDSDLTRYAVYSARAGENLARIAKAYGVTVADIKKLNNFAYDRVYASKVFFIPRPGTGNDIIDAAFSKDIARLSPKYYVVRKGDNLSTMSKRHNLPLTVLVKLNPKVNPSRIYPGQVIVISQGGLTS